MSVIPLGNSLFSSIILGGFMKFKRSQGIADNYVDDNINGHISKDPADLILDAIGYIPQLVHSQGRKLKNNF